MNASDLKGLPVIAVADGARVGTVEAVLLDTQLRHVVGFRIKHGRIGTLSVVRRGDVASVDENAVSIADASALAGGHGQVAPDDTVSFDQARGTPVLTESGRPLGKVGGMHLDTDAVYVVSYVLAGSPLARLRRVEPSILADDALRLDEGGALIVTDAAAEVVNQPDWKVAQGYIER